jgi:RNAse (barnase) inhibitor barstar
MSTHTNAKSLITKAIVDPAGAWLRTVTAPADDVYDAAIASDRHGAPVRIIRGRQSMTADALFDELSAALQFPPHFGRNWDAVLDSLRDARDRHPSGLTLVVLDAAKLLSADAAQRAALDRVLEQAHRDAEDPRGKPPAKTFRVVMHET